MRAPLQARDHLVRLSQVCWFAEDLPIKEDQRIGPKNQRIGKPLGHGASFAMGVELTQLRRCQMIIREFGHGGGYNFESRDDLLQ
jgi:hypothetical protein